jgi:hypothetical protein
VFRFIKTDITKKFAAAAFIVLHFPWTTLKKEEESSSETPDTVFQSTRCHDPEYFNFINVAVRTASLVLRPRSKWSFEIQ